MTKLLTQDGRPFEAYAVFEVLPERLRSQPLIRRLHTHLGILVEAGRALTTVVLEADLAEDPERLDLRPALTARSLPKGDSDTALRELAEIQHRNPGFRHPVGHRGIVALIEQLKPAALRVGAYRCLLPQH